MHVFLLERECVVVGDHVRFSFREGVCDSVANMPASKLHAYKRPSDFIALVWAYN